MVAKKKSYRIKIILGLSNINADFLQLILSMFVSHRLVGNPLYGAALFLFANIWILYFQGNLRNLGGKAQRRTNVVMWILLAVSVIAGITVIFLYPMIASSDRANLVSFFVVLLAARSALTGMVNTNFSKPRPSHRWYKALFQLLFLLPCIGFCFWQMEGAARWVTIVGFAVTGALGSYQGSTLASLSKYLKSPRGDKFRDISSYRVFSNMSLYSQIAFSLGVLMYVCYVSFSNPVFSVGTYLMMAAWIVVVLFSSELFSRVVNRNGRVLSLNFFIVGAALWILGSVQMFDLGSIWNSTFWTLFWGFGLACITSVLNRYNMDFKMVARIADRRVSDRDLYFRTLVTQIIAVIVSNVIMLCFITLWTFVIPNHTGTDIPVNLRRIMIQLPVIFMIISVFFALRQPLDRRSRQKLVNYYRGTNQNKPTKENLNEHLVQKDRVRFGVKIIAFFVRPFLHLKVFGQHNMDMKNFPSVFVCNHGIIYGPVTAVIYLPTYFRPWIDRKMVDRDLAASEMNARFIYRIPLLSVKAKMWIARQLARPVTWALNSFNPIPVEKNHLRGVMSTFDDTVKVLTEGDNVLIFPEKPRRVKRGKKITVEHRTDTVGSLYTGFASIGTLYHEKTGKCLRFYPIFANRKGHTFKIGEPVVFDPSGDPHQEKQRIAGVLHERMMNLRT